MTLQKATPDRSPPAASESPRISARRYLLAFGCLAAGYLLRILLAPFLGHTAFAALLASVLAAAWIGGIGPCLLVQTTALLIEAMWFHEDREPARNRLQASIMMGMFYGVGLAVAVLSELVHAARRREKSRKEEALAERERLIATLACIGDGVLVTDERGRLSMMNAVAQELTGRSLPAEEMTPLTTVLKLVDESQQPAASPVDRALTAGQIVHESGSLMLVHAAGSLIPISYSAAPIRDAEDRILGVVVVVRDETDRRNWEESRREADRRKDEFLATLAHELRNPLSPIRTGVELLKLSGNDPQAIEEVGGMIARQTDHLVRLVDDLLDVSRITRGKLELRRGPVTLSDVLRDAVERVQPLIKQSEHGFEMELPSEPVHLHGDASRLTQVFANLLDNAAKYTPRGGRIRLSATADGDRVRVVVTDNGVGIPREKLANVFDMYAQINGSKMNGHAGLGIGLTLVKRLVELHDGTVAAESNGRSAGSRFTVDLPLVRAATDAVAQTSPAIPARSSRRRILIADDNQDALESLHRLLKLQGHEVCSARDGLQALEKGGQFLPDVVLLDLGMPRLNGLEAARQIRAETWGEKAYLIAVTGWGQEEDRRRTREAGFDEHLVKPVEIVALEFLLAEVAKGQSLASAQSPLVQSVGETHA